MRLAESDVDTQRAAFGNAAVALGVPIRQVEKDFWATMVLRSLTAEMGQTFLFKGGTSLSKGWGVVRRFSEDVDLLLLSTPGEETDDLLDAMTRVAESVCRHEAEVTRRTDGLARIIEIPYPIIPDTPRARGMRRGIRLEPGVRGGPRPHADVRIAPLLNETLSDALITEWEDLEAFEVSTLHPGRTMVEKLFAVHSFALGLLSDPDRSVRGTEARHFYDLYFLADSAMCPALELLRDGTTYEELVADCEQVSELWYPESASKRPTGGFANSPAITDERIATRIAPAFETTMEELCYPDAVRPTFPEVLRRLRSLDWL